MKGCDGWCLRLWCTDLGTVPFGYGLSYTTFDYANLNASQTEFTACQQHHRIGRCHQQWTRGRKEELCSSSAAIRWLHYPPMCGGLRGFEKISLDPGETQTVTVQLCIWFGLAFVNKVGKWILEEGDFMLQVGVTRLWISNARKPKIWESPNK